MQTKTITIKKRGGGTRKQKVQVLASGKFKFIKNKAKSAGRKIRSVGKKTNKAVRSRSRSNTMAKQQSRSRSKSTAMKLYDKKNIKVIAIKTLIGGLSGFAIRLGTMFFQQPTIREAGQRAAATTAAYLGSGTGELLYQGIDAGVSRLILMNRSNGNGNGGIVIPNPLAGGA